MCHRRPPDYSCLSYMGIHLDQQKIEAIIMNSELQITYTAVVKYDVDLPEYGTNLGVHVEREQCKIIVNPVMYVHALDMLFNCLVSQGANLHLIGAIGSAAHHHGCVFWSLAGFKALCGLNSLKRMHEQLTEKCFTLPIMFWWKSLDKERVDMEDAVGGASEMRRITGSECSLRTTGPKIKKISNAFPKEYEETVRISLLSSFLASLLIANIASIEYSNASLMNLLDIHKKEWSEICLDACAPGLKSRLMRPVASNQLQGRIGKHLVERWNFRQDCMILSATSTSPSMLASLKEKNFMILSLSHMDSLVQPVDIGVVPEEGFTMCHPTVDDANMSLLKFRNGGNVRDRTCQELANGDWDVYNEMLNQTPKGNDGCLVIHFDFIEAHPPAQGTLRWDKSIIAPSETALHGIETFKEPRYEARATIEGQMMHYCVMAANRGVKFDSETIIIATGEDASNEKFLEIAADVFNKPVYTINSPVDPCLLGAAYRARYAFYKYRESGCNCRRCKIRRGREPQLSYTEYIQRTPYILKLAAEPTPGCDQIYGPMLERCREMGRLMAASMPIEENVFKYSKETLRPL